MPNKILEKKRWLGVFVILPFLIQTPTDNPSAQEVGTNPDFLMVEPDTEAEDPFAAVLDPLMDAKLIPGFYFSVHQNGEKVYERIKGSADLQTNLTPSEDTIYFMASMTKPIVTAAVLKLVEQGKLSLTQEVSDFLPSFEHLTVLPNGSYENQMLSAKTKMTIHHLLTHTSGLTYTFAQNNDLAENYRALGIMSIESLIKDNDLGDLSSHVEKLGELPLQNHPGEQMIYSVSTDVLGKIIEAITGEELSSHIEKSIFSQLDMSDATFWVEPEKADRLARLYAPLSKVSSSPDCQDCKNYIASPLLDENIKNFGQAIPKTWDSGGAGSLMTARDWTKFVTMILNGGLHNNKKFLAKKSVELMTSHQLPAKLGSNALVKAGMGPAATGFGFTYGLGIAPEKNGTLNNPESYDYLFWLGAANTAFWIDPVNKLSGIFLTQLYPIRYPSIFQLQEVADQMFGSKNE